MKLPTIILVTSVSFVQLGNGQGAFPLKPSESSAELVKPLVDPTGKDDSNPPTPSTTPDPNALQSEGKKASPSTAPMTAASREPAVVDYVIASGQSLTLISSKAYGRTGYWRLLKLYNECDPAKLKIGQVIKAPDIQWLLEEEGIVPLLKDAADSMMEGRKLFMEVEDDMAAAGLSAPDEEMKAKISEAQKQLAISRELFADKREGVPGLPNSTLLQIRTASELMGKVAQGSDVKTNRTQVHERFGNAITYCVLWAREGFN